MAQTAAIIERIDSDRCDGIGDGDAGEAAAIIERIVSYSGDGICRPIVCNRAGDGE